MGKRYLLSICTAAVIGGGVLVPAASADPPTLIGGINVAGYCRSLGYVDATLIKGGVVGPNYAYANWRCVTSTGSTHPFSMEQACKWMYGVQAIQAQPTDPNNAFTWNCYAPGNHSG